MTYCWVVIFPIHFHQIFIPINDAGDDHWFLAVFNIPEGECEIWDSNYDRSSQERREGYVKCAV